MVERRRSTGLASFARFLCVLSLVLVGFAHRPVAYAGPASTELSSYVLPDGTLPTLCVAGEDAGGKSGAAGGHCEFCRIAGGALLVQPAGIADQLFALVPMPHARSGNDQRIARVFTPGASPRGPPTLGA